MRLLLQVMVVGLIICAASAQSSIVLACWSGFRCAPSQVLTLYLARAPNCTCATPSQLLMLC